MILIIDNQIDRLYEAENVNNRLTRRQGIY